MDRQQKLDTIAAEIVTNNVCPELRVQATQLVMGRGNPQADIVFIGEAPGKQEDLKGVPFIGSAGKILTEALHSIGLEREEVYITNVVKYRPPNNRDPKPEEKSAFLPFLTKELSVIQPRLIVTLGRHSTQYFLPNAVIGKVRGSVNPIIIGEHATVCMPLYHPAATLYNRALQEVFRADFLSIPQVLESQHS